MSKIGYGYGSEWHLLRYLGRHRHKLNQAIEETCGGRVIDWLDFDFGLESNFFDAEWEGLNFLAGDLPVREAWQNFWPQKGSAQNWDAVGLLQRDTGVDLLLVEAKAHFAELKTSCGASENGGKPQIREALDETKTAFGIDLDKNWLEPYYQFCNRLAVLHFLTKHSISARLVFIYFYAIDGIKHENEKCPDSIASWTKDLKSMHGTVGLTDNSALEKRIHDVFLPIADT